MRRAGIIALVVAIAAGSSTGHSDEAQCRFSSEDMTADLAQLEQSVAHDWAYLAQRRFDLAGTFARARARLPAQAGGATFRAVLEEIVAGMADGHGFAFLPCEKRQFRRWPFSIVDTTDGLIVDDVKDTAAIAHGVRLLAIEGVPIEKLVASAEQRVAASSSSSRRALALAQLTLTTAEHLDVRVRDNDGQLHTAHLETVPLTADSDADMVETRDLGNGVSYLRISSFSQTGLLEWLKVKDEVRREQFLSPARRRIESAFDAIAGSRALILDLRGNGGGTDLLGRIVTDHLLRPGYVYFSLSARQVDGHWSYPRAWTFPSSRVAPYAGRVVVLIDERTASTSDNVARCLRDNRPDIVFVGRPTAGTSGAPRAVTLAKTGASVQFCTMRVYGPKGVPIEGHPVEPDIRRPKRRIDVVRHIDTDLAAALDALGWRPPG